MKCIFCQYKLEPCFIDNNLYTSYLTCRQHKMKPVFYYNNTPEPELNCFYFELMGDNHKYQIYRFMNYKDLSNDQYGKIEIWRLNLDDMGGLRVMKTMEDTPDNALQKLKTYLTFL